MSNQPGTPVQGWRSWRTPVLVGIGAIALIALAGLGLSVAALSAVSAVGEELRRPAPESVAPSTSVPAQLPSSTPTRPATTPAPLRPPIGAPGTAQITRRAVVEPVCHGETRLTVVAIDVDAETPTITVRDGDTLSAGTRGLRACEEPECVLSEYDGDDVPPLTRPGRDPVLQPLPPGSAVEVVVRWTEQGSQHALVRYSAGGTTQFGLAPPGLLDC